MQRGVHPWTNVALPAGACLRVRCRVGVSVWELSDAVFLESAHSSLPPHKWFTVTIPQQRYKSLPLRR